MHVGIVGGGRMAKDVFDLFVRAGFQVTLYARRLEAVSALDEELLGPLRKRVAKGGSRAAAAEAQLKLLKVTANIQDLAECDLINENISEDLEVKRTLFQQLEGICRPDCLLTSDSSFYPPDQYAVGLAHPERVLGLHFFAPVRLTSFCEVIPGPQTSEQARGLVLEAVEKLRIRPIVCRNIPGFLVIRMIPAFYMEGILILEEGIFTAAQIDGAVRGKLSHLGPLEASDMVGLDLVHKGNVLFPDIWRDGWIAPPLLAQLVAEGRLGQKTGSGLYAYPEGKAVDQSDLLPVSPRRNTVSPYELSDVVDRLYYTMVVEAWRQRDLQAGTAEDIDATLCEVLGFKRGPLASSQEKGQETVRERLKDLEARFGQRFAPLGSLA